MMKRSSIAALCLAGTAACMPLEQAPLVYSSKQQMGVGVAVGTPDSPGFDVNIGYKGLDAAFVPVAFAKRCDPKVAGTCPKTDYNIGLVLGLNRTKGLNEVDARELENIRRKLAIVDEARDSLGEQLKVKRSQLAAVKSASADQGVVQTLTATTAAGTLPTLTAEQDAQLLDARARLALAAGVTEPAVNAEITDLEKKLTAKNDAAAILGQAEANLLAQRRQSSDDDKKDALSVYGSFGGDAKGDKEGAGLKLGKVFSTGVAAQNVSQGIRNASKLAAAGECMVKAKDLIGDSKDPVVLAAAVTACKPPLEYGDPLNR